MTLGVKSIWDYVCLATKTRVDFECGGTGRSVQEQSRINSNRFVLSLIVCAGYFNLMRCLYNSIHGHTYGPI